MNIAVFGASGKIGSEVVNLLSPTHEIIKIGARSGNLQADYTDDASVKSIFDNTKNLDAVITCVGSDSQFKPYSEISDDDFRYGAERKLVAQFRIVRYAEQYLNDNGSITITVASLVIILIHIVSLLALSIPQLILSFVKRLRYLSEV